MATGNKQACEAHSPQVQPEIRIKEQTSERNGKLNPDLNSLESQQAPISIQCIPLSRGQGGFLGGVLQQLRPSYDLTFLVLLHPPSTHATSQ